MSVVIETTLGDITVDLYTDERPRTCQNFLKLCKLKYYNLCLFHKIEQNFIAQSGDPTGTGRGGESVYAKLYGEQAKYFEAETKPRLRHTKLGTLSMVNNGDNMHGSQFFLTLGERLDSLDGVHGVFGEVSEGEETLARLNETFCDASGRPYQDIRITHTVVLDDPYDDPPGLDPPDASPKVTPQALLSDRIGAHEVINDAGGKTMEEIEEEIQAKEARARATILEMIGDLPDVDVAPPDNVLFVCKLNPVTTDEDLEIIFSRFGEIKSCEVIRDRKSGDSLQYAFIEFVRQEDCENAFFKMDNVLIDDRRIHVDFSQSVSKLRAEGKGGVQEAAEKMLKAAARPRRDDRYQLILSDGGDDGDNEKQKKQSEKKHKKPKEDRKERHAERKRSRSPPGKHRGPRYEYDEKRRSSKYEHDDSRGSRGSHRYDPRHEERQRSRYNERHYVKEDRRDDGRRPTKYESKHRSRHDDDGYRHTKKDSTRHRR
ncbi:peptidyl-prolyl cis-trans isomerase sig-7-like [Ornithodoros turicata]|uniref:peptidyl-prolyl cis-trans isomerase sig-7-like n=1 Tax=Ornithodoros turicata TaxID=34597 RepID=UPI003139464D